MTLTFSTNFASTGKQYLFYWLTYNNVIYQADLSSSVLVAPSGA